MSVNAGDIVLASDYNSIRNTLYSLIVSEYGYISDTLPIVVSVGDIITQQQWSDLYTDISRCVVHQTNNPIPSISAPSTGSVVLASFVNALETAVNTAYTNRYTVHPSQLISDTTNAVSTRVAGWNSSLSHSVRYEWPDSGSLDAFFKLGGKITIGLSYPSGSYSAEELTWANLINFANLVLVTNSGAYQNSDLPGTKIFTASSDGTNQITVTYTKNLDNRSITATIDLVVGGPTPNVDLDVTSTMTHYYSANTLGPSPRGVPATRPSVQQLVGLDGGGTGGVSPTKILSVSPSSKTFSLYAGSQSGEDTITLTNLGNTTLTLTDIQYTAVSYGFTPLPNYTGLGGSAATTIAAGASKTFILAYSATSVGNAYGSIRFISDNDSGLVSIPLTVISLSVPFDFTLTPSSWSPTVINDSPISQKFTIVPTNGSYSFYISTLPSYGLFTMNNTASDGPTITFNTGATLNGTYNTTLSVTVNSITKTVPISVIVNRDLVATKNFGTWISAYGPTNSVIGFSYDKINNLKYLTIGIGGGADGIAALSASGQVSVTNLGINADSKYGKGVAMYKSTSIAGGFNNNWSSFLTNNGVWIRSEDLSTQGFRNQNITRTFSFRVEIPGVYYWNATVDDNAYISIDNVLVADLTSGQRWPRLYSGQIPFSLTAGLHSISFTFNNNGGGPCGMAISITDNLNRIIWSTLDPVRTEEPYLGWAEVYRISVNAGPRTYYCDDVYCVKDSSAATTAYDTVARKYNDYFGSASLKSLIKVDDDGFGNLSITLGSRYSTPSMAGGPDVRNTVDFLGEAFYYYSEQRSTYYFTTLGRITQLEPKPLNGLTKYFIGFDSGGTVKTTSLPYPTGVIATVTPSVTDSGGGCPAPWHKILLSSGQLINAGELQVGMEVRTQHEHTLEWGNHAVTFVQIQQQDRMEVLFDHCRFICSTTHKFHIQGTEWRESNEIAVGDVISGHTVKEVNYIENGDVVKITVDGAHTYICEGMLSHNKQNPNPL